MKGQKEVKTEDWALAENSEQRLSSPDEQPIDCKQSTNWLVATIADNEP